MKKNEYEIVKIGLPISDGSFLSREVDKRVVASLAGTSKLSESRFLFEEGYPGIVEIQRMRRLNILKKVGYEQLDLGVVTNSTIYAVEGDPVNIPPLFLATEFGFRVGDLTVATFPDSPRKYWVETLRGIQIGTDVPACTKSFLRLTGANPPVLLDTGQIDSIELLRAGIVDAIAQEMEPGFAERNGLETIRKLEEVKSVLVISRELFEGRSPEFTRSYMYKLIQADREIKERKELETNKNKVDLTRQIHWKNKNMNKEQEQQIKNDRRLFIALVGTYGLILGLGIIESCNNRLRGVETICYPTASRAGLECIEKPILKGGD